MNPVLRKIIAVVAGIVLGNIVNMAIIMISSSIIPIPDGADNTTMEGLKNTIHLFEPKHFILPFLAHALGTFAGAYIAARIASINKMTIAFAISGVFLLGGIYMAIKIPDPKWFVAIDLLFAYIPMGYLAGKAASLASKNY